MPNYTTTGPLVIISDMHLGRRIFKTKSCRPEDLVNFFDWLNNSRKIKGKNGTITKAKIPKKIILLGDFLELWAPASEREILLDVYPVLFKLIKIVREDQEIIYVRGNHDQNIKRYVGKFEPNLHIYDKHVTINFRPKSSKSKKIVLLHGDAFIWGRTRGISSRIMGYFYRIASDLEESTRLIISAAFIILSFLYYLIFYTELFQGFPIPSLIRDIYMGLLGIGCFYTVPTLIRILGLRLVKRSAIKGIQKLKIRKLMLQRKAEKVSSEIRQRFYDTLQKPSYAMMKEIINGTSKTLWWNFQDWWNRHWKGKAWRPEIIIFGHTHVPEGPVMIKDIEGIDMLKITKKLENIILVNSGSWIKEGIEDNTNFIFINDDGGIHLCRFDINRKIGVELGNLEEPYSK